MKIVTFGEIMLRLAPENNLRFMQESKFEATFGGGEANVAVSLANFGMNSAFVTKLPQNDIAQGAVRGLRYFGVDTTNIVRGGNRIGIYFLEKGASQRPSKVIYDRKNTSISEAETSDFDWDEIFKDVDWFHFTGITPALSDNVAKICKEALIAAKKKSVTVSCDLNYRKNLWSKEKAKEVMSDLMQFVDVCIGNEEDAEIIFSISPSDNNVEGGKLNKSGYEEVANKLIQKFGFKTVAISLRESLSASDNKWSAMLQCGAESYFSQTYMLHIVDRVGGGDSFAAGIIYGLCKGIGSQKTLDFAVASSCLKHSIQGDYNRVTVEEVEGLLKNGSSGRVQR